MRWPAFLITAALAKVVLRRRSRIDRDIADELDAHLSMAIADRVARGESPEDARLAVMRELGNVRIVKEETRRVWTSTTFEQLFQDLRFGGRILWHSPGLSASAVVLIALVIGGNTTVYSAVHRILTAPANGVTADRLIGLGEVNAETPRFGYLTSYPNFLDYAARATTVERLVAWASEGLTLGIDGTPHAVYGSPVTPGFFETLGVSITVGRGLRPDDERLDTAGLVAVISDRLWREHFQQAPDIAGRGITVNGQPTTIVGVAGPGFRGGSMTPGEDIWLPIEPYHQTSNTREALSDRRRVSVLAVGRLARGVSPAEAQAEFAAIATQLNAAYPDENKNRRAIVFRYSGTAFLPVSNMAPVFLAVFSLITALTLLIVSANVANLMLARAVVRQRETAVRQSLGASRGRIVRMLLAEGLTIALTAWAAAFMFAWWVSRALVGWLPPSAQQGQLLPDMRPDWQVAAYAMLLALCATLVFMMAPALRTWRQPVLPWLKAGEQGIAQGRSAISSGLVILQLAFSVLLLTTAGLAHRSLSLLDSGDVGFEQDNLLLATVRTSRDRFLPTEKEGTPDDRAARFVQLERLRERLGSIHEVTAVTYTRRIPGPYLLSPTPVWRSGNGEPIDAMRRLIGPDYLQTLGLSVVAGRDFGGTDRPGAQPVAVLSQRLATMLFPGQSPLGQRVQIGAKRQEEAEVVGIAPDALYDGPTHDPQPAFVFLAEQQFENGPTVRPTFFIRYRGTLDALTPAVRTAIADVDDQLPIVGLRTMRSTLESVTGLERQIATMLLFFAGASLLIAGLGQYAITAFNMRRRTRDFGVRMALGASSQQIQSGVLREALRLTLVGLVIGFGLSVAVGLAFRGILFGITPTDPTTYAAVFALLALASLVASYLPAWRASRVNVVEALRQE